MKSGLQAASADRTPCKCCGATAHLYGLVDFHKNCESYRRAVLGLSGIPIYYHRCPDCGFVFTTALDHFTPEDFRHHIYNEDYLLVDPDYQGGRARANADFLAELFSEGRPGRILDYGGGKGDLAESLRAAGYSNVESYDPFVPEHSARPSGRFDCVVCFEVVEHSTDPGRTFAEILSFLDEPGMVIFSTLLLPDDFEQVGLGWWYASPRNGHVSLYTPESLRRVIEPLGYGCASFNQNTHILYREIPEFARSFLIPMDQYEVDPYTTTVLV